jgi:hypothetical protein
MDWARVADRLFSEGRMLHVGAESAFPNNPTAQREMRTMAIIFITFAEALRAGLQEKV